ncbi:hypothetical protein [Streptomyces ipomoeae]|uniref:hypothetical protein n=1 Tax=Streptomyces ipomoeae TaxID=103232 RepID=UPI00299FA151|nr:hypothetical protein [Streptomyces ipomoeae]MDX2700397.1 hypothetical protein [Streptomyces ipomoeae]
MNSYPSSAFRIAHALVRHELLLMTSLLRWLVRRPHGVGEAPKHPYTRPPNQKVNATSSHAQ